MYLQVGVRDHIEAPEELRCAVDDTRTCGVLYRDGQGHYTASVEVHVCRPVLATHLTLGDRACDQGSLRSANFHRRSEKRLGSRKSTTLVILPAICNVTSAGYLC